MLDLITELLKPNKELTWDLLDLFNTHTFQAEPFIDDLFTLPNPIGRTRFRFKRSGINGTIDSYKEEINLSEVDNATSSNSLSMNRKFNNRSDSLRGKSSYLPFQPGGLIDSQYGKDNDTFLHKTPHGLFDIPPGFDRGLNLDISNDDIIELGHPENEEASQSGEEVNTSLSKLTLLETRADLGVDTDEMDGIVPLDFFAIQQEIAQGKEVKQNWAHIVDLDHRIDDFEHVVPNMARKWPFELDTFQQEAIYHLEQGDSVFVAAHTSAGKTVVAEYAIAMAKRNMTKTIYTSPIKALSNQKFRDFKETFTDIDVGLITGDVQINPEADCLIMTTEILRSMLYRGADLIRDVEFVIFDEVHYVNDIDRGVVWEEVIIMLPDHVKYILLSATVPNTFEFANWVGRTKQKDIYVISTPKRPVPLEVFIWAKQSLFKVIDAGRKFLDVEFDKHKQALEGTKKPEAPNVTMGSGLRGGRGGTARGGNRGGGGARGRGGQERRGGMNFNKNFISRDGPNKSTWLNLVQYLKNHSLLPAVIFVFSKKRCEEYADSLKSTDLCTAKEKSEIHMFIDRAISRLKRDDRELPQIIKIREMLSRGIAVHHGGLLPIVKECIEILFSKTLVKVLFATETFAMGLNLPTRTVVFSEIRKHDGKAFRNLLAGEFTQMAGRAGRRGLDPTGTVILMSYKEPLYIGAFKEVTLGTPTKLISQFRLKYNMILNLLRIEALRVEEMIKHSFSENTTQTLLPTHQKRVDELTHQLTQVKIDACSVCDLEDMDQLYQEIKDYETVSGHLSQEFDKSPMLRHVYLKTGRLVCYRDKNDSTKCGFIVRSDFTTKKLLILSFDHGPNYTRKAAAHKLPYIPIKKYLTKNFPKIQCDGKFEIEAVEIEAVVFISPYKLRAFMQDILRNQASAIDTTKKQIMEFVKSFPYWKPIQLDKSVPFSMHERINEQKRLISQIKSRKCLGCDSFRVHYQQYRQKYVIEEEINSLQKLLSDENLELLPDYEQRLEVLEDLKFIDDKHNVLLKGRVACEVNSGWELIITELVLDNFLADFEPEEIVALLSSFVYEGKTNEDEDPPVTPRLERGKKRILEIADDILKVYVEHKVLMTPEEEKFTQSKRFALMNVVYEWARGMSFNDIMAISVEAEGTIVHVITRLDEVCREVKKAALIIGDSGLHFKMTEAQERIKRDIVFCGSLYL